MKISIIGAGNIAHFIGMSFSKGGHLVHQVYNRSIESGKRLAGLCEAMFIDDLKNLSADVDAVFIAVKDNAIKEIAQKLKLGNTLLIHCAGAVPLDVLRGGSQSCGVIWPLYSVHKGNLPSVKIPLILETGEERRLAQLEEVAAVLSDKVWVARAGQREKMHLAAVTSNNFMNHLAALTEKIMKEDKLPFELLKPLLHQTFENIINGSPCLKQTGPAIRNDRQTMEKHLEMLKKHPEMHKVYEVMSASILALHAEVDNKKIR